MYMRQMVFSKFQMKLPHLLWSGCGIHIIWTCWWARLAFISSRWLSPKWCCSKSPLPFDGRHACNTMSCWMRANEYQVRQMEIIIIECKPLHDPVVCQFTGLSREKLSSASAWMMMMSQQMPGVRSPHRTHYIFRAIVLVLYSICHAVSPTLTF